ncbi:MAG: hypothetical protein DHS80DRAFT_30013 [Piptocephalis tieghemiana]|nr:MAG: hypothetical protein DHS80DRAFT_30013 [Piptocephalis tieghemiana]
MFLSPTPLVGSPQRLTAIQDHSSVKERGPPDNRNMSMVICLGDQPILLGFMLSSIKKDHDTDTTFAKRHHFRTLADPGWIYIAFPIPLTTGCLFQLLDKSSTAWLSITPFLSTVLALVSLALGQHRGWKSLLTLLIILSLLLVASSLLDPETILSRHAMWLSETLIAYGGMLYLLMHHLRRNLSYGEASILAQSISLLMVNAAHRIFQAGVVPPFLALVEGSCIGLLPVMLITGTSIGHRSSSRSRFLTFFTVLFTFVGVGMYPWLQVAWKHEPILWLLKYLLAGGWSKIILCIHWIVCACFFILTNRPTLHRTHIQVNSQRKWFHLAVVVLFVPGILVDRAFLSLSLAAALAFFFLLEGYRSGRVPPWGQALNGYFREFADVKESLERGSAVLSHIYLLLGVSIPIWLPGSTLSAYLGILTLGVGDALASIVGKRWGYHTWAGSLKSMEGTVAFVLSILVTTLLLTLFSEKIILSGTYQWIVYTVCISLTGMLEAVSLQNDNLIIPIYAWLVLNLSGL